MAKASSSTHTSDGSRRAVVTGASSGIGAAFARQLARDGYDLIVVARRRDRLDALADELHAAHQTAVEVLAADLTEAAELRVVEKVIEDADLDLVVNNAGFGTAGAFATLDVETEEEEIRLNVVALVHLTRAALPAMLLKGSGGIINVSSMAGMQPAPYNATYGATKAFVNSFTEALHEEVRDSGIRVQVLCPGFTRTEFQDRAGINVADLPSLVWMTPEAVVAASLSGLARGEVVCVPGFTNRAVATLTSAVPRALVRRVYGTVAKRLTD